LEIIAATFVRGIFFLFRWLFMDKNDG